MPAVALDGEFGAYNIGGIAGGEGADLDALDLHAIKNDNVVAVGLSVVLQFNQLDAGKSKLALGEAVKVILIILCALCVIWAIVRIVKSVIA